MTIDKEKVREALKSYDDGWTMWRDERAVVVAAARAWLDGQEVGTTDSDKDMVLVPRIRFENVPPEFEKVFKERFFDLLA